MGAVVSSTTGLRTGRRVSHVFVMDVPAYPRVLLITDAAINIYPDLDCKADICRNAIDLAHPQRARARVAILSAVETINPKIESTLHAAAAVQMADRGQIAGGLLAFRQRDLARGRADQTSCRRSPAERTSCSSRTSSRAT